MIPPIRKEKAREKRSISTSLSPASLPCRSLRRRDCSEMFRAPLPITPRARVQALVLSLPLASLVFKLPRASRICRPQIRVWGE